MGKHKNRFEFQSVNFLTFVWAKRSILFKVVVAAAVISIVVSLTIKPRFRSTVILFPSSSASVSKTLLTTNPGANDDILRFGGEEEGEQLMQVLQSSEIRERIIKKFNLSQHYKIDTSGRYWRTQLREKYNGNISYRRTEYMSLIIDVLDTDPEKAALIANEISNQVDSVMNRIQKERAKKAFEIVEKEYKELVSKIALLEDSLRRIRELGVMDYESQVEVFNTAYTEALSKGNKNAAAILQQKLATIAQYGGAYVSIRDLLSKETQRLSDLNAKYMEARVDAEQAIPHKFVVDKAYKAEKKAYPKRLLIVLASTISAFFMALVILIILETVHFKPKD